MWPWLTFGDHMYRYPKRNIKSILKESRWYDIISHWYVTSKKLQLRLCPVYSNGCVHTFVFLHHLLYYGEFWILLMEFRKELWWRLGLFSALCDKFQLDKKEIKWLKPITICISRLFSSRLGKGGLFILP